MVATAMLASSTNSTLACGVRVPTQNSKRIVSAPRVVRAQAFEKSESVKGLKKVGLNFVAGLVASQAVFLPFAGSALAASDKLDLGPNEVTQQQLGDLPGASKFDQAAPGRSGQTFFSPEEATQVGKAAVDNVKENVQEKLPQVPSVGETVENVKNALPDLSSAEDVINPDAADLGPNEVGRKELSQFPAANNPFDTAAPGRVGGVFKNLPSPQDSVDDKVQSVGKAINENIPARGDAGNAPNPADPAPSVQPKVKNFFSSLFGR